MDRKSLNNLPLCVNHEDLGTSLKKKKERENRNSVNSDVLHDWSQRDSWVTISLITSGGHDEAKAKVEVLSNHVSITLADGRRFSTKLYAEVVPQVYEKLQKSNKFVVRLMKHDPLLNWPTLTPSDIASNKNRSNNCMNQNVNNNNTINKSQARRDGGDGAPLPEVVCDKTADSKENIVLIKDQKIKLDFYEPNDANQLTLFIYIKKIVKESVKVTFSERNVTIRFSTSDSQFLASEPGSNSSTVFVYELPLLGAILPDQGSHVVSNTKMEIKMKKAKPGLWQAVSPCSAAPAMNVKEKTMDAVSSPAPPPPPTPPTPVQHRKPTCQVLPSPSNRMEDKFTFSSSSSSSSGLYSSGALSTYGSSSGTPGYMGLENIGNTCFMNSVLQTLLNTRELRHYFLSPQNYYQKELNKRNPLGQGGKLAVAFAVLMNVAWNQNCRSFAPTKLKAVMSLKANQFSGFAQHDAQELMVEMLDGLHEDLNRVREKPYCAEPPELDGWSDVDAAAKSWHLHKLRNDSVIDDLFKGQFRSALTCHECGKISVKFDEFCCLSVPIPKDQKVVEVTFFYKLALQRPVRLSVRINADAGLEDLKREIGLKVKVNPLCIEILEVFKHRVQKIFDRGSSIESIEHNDVLLAFEVLIPEQVGGEEVVQLCVTQRLSSPPRPGRCACCGRAGDSELRISRCQKCLTVGYCSRECQKTHAPQHSSSCRFVHEPVGAPFIISMPKSHATYTNLTRAMESYARHSVTVFQPPVTAMHGPGNSRGAVGGVQRPVPGRRQDSTSSYSNSDDEITAFDEVIGGGANATESMDVEMETAGSCDEEEIFDQTGDDVFDVGAQAASCPTKQPSSAGVCAVPPQVERPSASQQLFTVVPVSSRGQSLQHRGPLVDLGDEPLDLDNTFYLAMDWKTAASNTNDVVCLINNKDIDCEDMEPSASYVGPYGRSGRQSTTLQACMDLFTQPENLSEGDSWRCPRCKKPVEATKQMSLWKLPPVLIVQLKRFSFKYVLYSDKIDKFVKYPVNGLDVGAHIAPGGGDGGSSLYDLYGVVNHMGRLLGGHYTAYVRTLRENSSDAEIDWRLCDDSRVVDVSEDRVVNDQAYLLVYRRRDTPFILPSLTQDPTIEMSTDVISPIDSNVLSNSNTIPNGNIVSSSNIISNAAMPPANTASNFDALLTTVVSRPQSSVVHVQAAPMGSTSVTVSPMTASSYGSAGADMPHSNLHNMRISRENNGSTQIAQHVTMINTGDNADRTFTPTSPSSPLHCSNATSTINTNDAVCGNLVSTISIDDEMQSTYVPATPGHFLPTVIDSRSPVGQVPESTFSASPFTSATRPMFIAGLNSENRNIGNNFYEPVAYTVDSEIGLGRGSGTVESTPSDCGVILDEVTPMSVSSASQPSLSSTEEESISTAQEELD